MKKEELKEVEAKQNTSENWREVQDLVEELKGVGAKVKLTKIDYSMVEPCVIKEIAKVMMDGAEKHGKDNYKSNDKLTFKYFYSRTLSHLLQWVDGEDINWEDGINNHISHAMANLSILTWLINNKPERDDR